MDNAISILIPAHNRSIQLSRAVQSVRKLFSNIEIFIGDNSSDAHAIEQNIAISRQYKCKYLSLYQYEANIYKVYLCLLEASSTSHILILEDDDMLVNKKTHALAQQIAIAQNSVVSFNIIDTTHVKLLYSNKMLQTSEIDRIPLFWNGQFQMGTTYFNRQALINAIQYWCKPDNILDFSNDECLTLLCIKQQKKYVHLPFVGSIIDKSFSISLSKEWSIFSCRKYIDVISQILNIDHSIVQKWKQIQLKELAELREMPIQYEDVFNNSRLTDVEKYIIGNLNTMPLPIIRQNATKMLYNILNQ